MIVTADLERQRLVSTMTSESVSQSSISVRYLEKSSIKVRGVVSGMYYEFSDSRPIQQVDARECDILIEPTFLSSHFTTPLDSQGDAASIPVQPAGDAGPGRLRRFIVDT